MSKTLIDIPDELLDEAKELLGTRTKADTVRQALAESIRRRRTPAIDRARRLDIAYSDVAKAYVLGVTPERADELAAAHRRNRG